MRRGPQAGKLRGWVRPAGARSNRITARGSVRRFTSATHRHSPHFPVRRPPTSNRSRVTEDYKKKTQSFIESIVS